MTSNIGTRQLKDFGQGVGFNTSARKNNASEHSKGVIENALKRTFAPEFLNRIDDVVLFNSLEKEDINKIIDIELKHVVERINTLGYEINISKGAKDFVASKGFDSKFGARPLKRAIQKYIEDPLAEKIINIELSLGDKINIKISKPKNELIFTIQKQEEQKPENKTKS